MNSLIRTQIETTLSQQSTDLLRSMNQRAQEQLRLQTVEGLSVLAISYYAIGIIGYILKPAMLRTLARQFDSARHGRSSHGLFNFQRIYTTFAQLVV